jgi:ATP-dependent helicase HrpB
MKTGLPVEAMRPALLAALDEPGGAAVLVADPGAGKTTVVPLALLDAPWRRGRVVVVEPRRLAARAAAERLASLLGETVGRTIGVRMRDDTRTSAATCVEIVTDGVLTRMLHADPTLEGVDAVVFDELHERSVETDVGVALSLDVRDALRPDLRLIAMSATIDGAAVASLLGTDAVLRSEGRSFPTEVVWSDAALPRFDALAVASATRRALRETSRDVLVFVPGAFEIDAVIRGLADVGADVLPLHGSLPASDQRRALSSASPGRRKVVVSTSVAETSLTIDGIEAVVDSGWSRRARFDPRRGMGGLVTMRVSQAAAEQRRGRAGRLAPGRCYRLWSEAEHQRLSPFDPPDILSTDHVPLALDLVRWGDPDGSSLRWLDAPPATSLLAARDLLRSLGLVDDRDRLTDDGRRASELPVHPRLARAIVEADELGDGAAAVAVAAVLDERARGRRGPAVDLHERVRRLSGRGVRQARRLADLAGLRLDLDHPSTLDAAGVGVAVALAYPDRVARRRGSSTRYLTTGGAGAELDPHDPLARSEWLAIAELDLRAGQGDATVRSAAALDADDVAVVVGPPTTVDRVEWDRRRGDVRAEREQRHGAIVVSTRAIEDAAGATEALLDGVRIEGLTLLPRWSETSRLRGRVRFLRRVLGDEWPDLGEDALLPTVDEWLAPWLAGARRRDDLARVDVPGAVRALLPTALAARLDELAPARVTPPNGHARAVDYDGEQPVVSLRLQDAFGWLDTPKVAGGRVSLTVELLSPAGRPLQRTSDLAGFWRGSYAQVRAEMRGRYPKHAWPEDPAGVTGDGR